MAEAKKTSKKSNKTAAQLIQDLDERDGSTLMAPLYLEEHLDALKLYLSQSIYVDDFEVPRYGLLSLKMQNTPCFVYGHPALKAITKTAFTDGMHIFICDEFYEKLIDDVENNSGPSGKGTEYGIEVLVLHELMHMMFNHVHRLRSFPKEISNAATDLSINTKLQLGYPDMPWCKTMRETGLGFQPGDLEKYAHLSEESIARDLLAESFEKNRKEKEKQGNEGQQQKGPGQGQQQKGPGQGQGQCKGQGQGKGQGQPGGQGEEDGDGQGGNDPQEKGGNDPSKGEGAGEDDETGFGQKNDNHMVDLQDLIEILEEAGLDKVIDSLKLPHADDPEMLEKIGELQAEVQMRDIDSIQKAGAQACKMNGKYPGSHIAEAAADMVRGFVKGKLSWKLAMREAVVGDGMKFRYDEEEPNEIFHIDEITKMCGTSVYIGQDVPYKADECVLVLIDTSGSVNEADIRTFLNEIFELKNAANGIGDAASEVIILSADTVLRGEPIEVNDRNVDKLMSQGVKVFGRGGTDLAHSLKQAIALPLFKQKKIKSVVFCTDLFDRPPQKSELNLDDDVSVVYVAAPSTHSSHIEEFAKDVASYARVYPIADGLEIDISETAMDVPVNTKKMKM